MQGLRPKLLLWRKIKNYREVSLRGPEGAEAISWLTARLLRRFTPRNDSSFSGAHNDRKCEGFLFS